MFTSTKKGTKMRIALIFVMLLVICGNVCAMKKNSRANVKPLDFSGKSRNTNREVDSENKFNDGILSRRPSAPREMGSNSRNLPSSSSVRSVPIKK